MESKGFGGTIDNLAAATGIKDITQNIADGGCGCGCGCGGRKKTLNDMFPYSKEKKTR